MITYLSIGSNLNDRLAAINAALQALAGDDQITVDRVSRIYETSPVGGVKQDDFYNIAAKVETTYSAHDLLDKIHQIEADLHRVREIHWGPRTIDLDILFYGNEQIDDEVLQVPHPELYRRKFVLVPLLDLFDADDPAYQKFQEASQALPADQAVRVVAEKLEY
ncbi:2-amino-4-hydroxy-6-hydroxymethyldihydropteridine diphosphokinase [Fructobacillus evanidus]|uniref:2-amino-4-hydroxy-6-hydroxymethyldihydropteridine diphosphokinase n=1 Tax=Fructobacillus evanidus TaxID=3064281 RepID=A0ABM9MU33_9LACO|nr:7 [Fructobacillus sp. LMG 32999] [Fructobacillus sp. LMG 32999]CAK1238794.1 7 [Fructobacillus sp. LMG 32999] [Fructobacillus sp. LMG 32999]CAK1239995.1 7 [Fructobacillus sp. LMG 32999] [Fructobacillus sp. LMG 32999]CAK1244690.1 7 [Fructobacillus sp. LMG 32999] [Fructobacillus sp. LMG 32999]CAK1244990.1 7 [Fructobacillus sp. LMG 32999] [Fructobacillus sp. LMG 32999]